jgi:hypothetical protein
MAVENVVDLKLNFDDSGVVKIQEKQIDLVKQQVKAFSDMEKAINTVYDDSVQQSKLYNDAIRQNLQELKAQDLQLKKTSTAADLYNKALDKATDVFGQFKDQATGAISGLKNYASGLVSSARSATGFVKVLKLVRVALIGTGIGAIVLALTGLVAAFGRTAAGGEKLSQIFKGITATVDVVIGRFATIGNAIIGLFTGTKTLSQATKEAAGAFNGLGKEMKAAFTEGQRIEKMYQQLEKSARQLSIDESQIAKRVAYLQTIAEQEGVSAGKAINAISSARKAEIDLTDRKIEQQELLLKNIQAEVKQTGRLGAGKELLDKEADARIELNNLETDRINLAAEYSSRIQQIREQQRQEAKERADQLKKLREDYQKLLGDLEKRLDKASVTGLDGIEKLLQQRDVAVAELVDFQKSIEESAKKAGVKLPDAVKAQIVSLYIDIQDTFEKEAIKFRRENPFSIETFLSFDEKTKLDAAQKLGDDVVGLLNIGQKARINEIKDLGEQLGKEAAANVQKGLNDAELNSRPLFQKIVDGLKQTFNVNAEQLGFITDQISSTISDLDNIISSGTQKQIAEQEELIKSIQDRVKTAEEAYNTELKLQEDGFANSAKLKEDDLKKEQARLAQAQQKKEELEKKALRQQLISDSLQQASQLALGAAKILTAESSKGLIGIITASAGIALLFRIIAQAKANAAKFSTPAKFRGGGQLLEGKSHEQGGIPIVIGNSRVVEAEGGEFIIRKRSSTINEEFFHNVNKGHYDHLDLTKTIEQANQGRELARRFNSMGEIGSRMAAQYRSRENSGQNRTTDKAISDRLDRLTYVVENVLETLEERPVITPIDTGYRKEYRRGRIKYNETFRAKKD